MTKDQVQEMAYEAWLPEKCGTICMHTGTGKTFVFLKALRDYGHLGRNVFFAEQIDRKRDLEEQIAKFEKLYDCKLPSIEFCTYQSAYKWNDEYISLACFDEVHDQMTAVYHLFHKNNKVDMKMGLTATPSERIKIDLETNKGDLLKKYLPIVFKYDIADAKKDENTRPLKVKVIYFSLEDKRKDISAGSKTKRFYVTEAQQYSYINKKIFFAVNANNKKKLDHCYLERARFLYGLPTRIAIVKKLLSTKPTIVFGNSLDALNSITPNTISSRNTDTENDRIRDDFEKGNIATIGAFKKLEQGANILGADRVILHSYYRSPEKAVQRLGRLRQNGAKLGEVIILVALGTNEEEYIKDWNIPFEIEYETYQKPN